MENENTQQIYEQKQVVYYQANLSAWTATRLETDKQLLTLSALAIGLLVTLRSELDDDVAFYVWLLAAVSFLVSIFSILRVFHLNSDYIEQNLADDDQEKTKGIYKSLKCYRLLVHSLFFTGVLLTAILVVVVYGTGFSTVKGP